MIDLCDESTWPSEILEILETTSVDTKREMQEFLEPKDNQTMFKEPPSRPIYGETRSKLETLLAAYEIRAFHCTRLLASEFNAIRQTGLQTLSRTSSKARVLDALRQRGLDEILLGKASQAFDECLLSGGYACRKGMLWFVLSEERVAHTDCSELFRYFGGEIARHALDAFESELFRVLESIGIPCVVEVRLPIRDAQPHHLSALAEELIRYGWNRFFEETHYTMCCDMMVRYSVGADRIVSVRENRP